MELVRQPLVVDPGDPLDVRRRTGEEPLELAAADDPEAELGGKPGCGEDRLQSVQRDQLADEEAGEGLGPLPAGPEEALLGSDEADLDPPRAQLAEERRMRLGVDDDEIGGAKCVAVESGERPGRQASAAKPPAVADERVGERDERVEDDRPAPCCMLGRGQVEVTGVADEHHVEGLLGRPSQPGLGRSEPKGDPRARPPLVLAPVPDRLVPLAHFDPRPAQA